MIFSKIEYGEFLVGASVSKNPATHNFYMNAYGTYVAEDTVTGKFEFFGNTEFNGDIDFEFMSSVSSNNFLPPVENDKPSFNSAEYYENQIKEANRNVRIFYAILISSMIAFTIILLGIYS